jgi:hypothetical protein
MTRRLRFRASPGGVRHARERAYALYPVTGHADREIDSGLYRKPLTIRGVGAVRKLGRALPHHKRLMIYEFSPID